MKSKSAMKEYYKKPDLTAQTRVDGWIHTGDLAEIDENGFVYIWGRCKDKYALPNDREIYLFDVANKIKEKNYIDDVMLFSMPTDEDAYNVVAHIVWEKSVKDSEKAAFVQEINSLVKEYEPDIHLNAYAFHKGMLPYSPTTLKKNRNRMAKQLGDYVRLENGKLVNIRFQSDAEGKLRIKTT